MTKLKEYNGFYGSQDTACTLLAYETMEGTFYCVQGSKTVNQTYSAIDGLNVDSSDVKDFDCFTWDKDIDDLYELERACEY